MWKKEALNIILDSISKVVNTKNKINFIEIGSASGLVSLFLAKWASKQNIDYEITAIEPSLPNVDYLMETAYLNNLKVNIIPMAISNKKEWLPFSQESSKGLVADGLRDNSPTNYVPTISIKDFSIYVKEVDICYVDAFLNENKILQELLLTFEEIKSFIIEFDYGIPNETLKLLNEKSYFLEKQVNTNYIFTRKT